MLLKLWSMDRRPRLPRGACQKSGISGPQSEPARQRDPGGFMRTPKSKKHWSGPNAPFTHEETEPQGEGENHPGSFGKCDSRHGSEPSPRPWPGAHHALLNCPPPGGAALCLQTGEPTGTTGPQGGSRTAREGGRWPPRGLSAALGPSWPLHRAQVCFRSWHSEPGPPRRPGARLGSADGAAPPSLSALHLVVCVH